MSSSFPLIEWINSYSPATSVVRGPEIRVMELARKSLTLSDLKPVLLATIPGLNGIFAWSIRFRHRPLTEDAQPNG